MKFSLKEINYTIVNKKNFTTLARKRDWTQSGKKHLWRTTHYGLNRTSCYFGGQMSFLRGLCNRCIAHLVLQ